MAHCARPLEGPNVTFGPPAKRTPAGRRPPSLFYVPGETLLLCRFRPPTRAMVAPEIMPAATRPAAIAAPLGAAGSRCARPDVGSAGAGGCGSANFRRNARNAGNVAVQAVENSKNRDTRLMNTSRPI